MVAKRFIEDIGDNTDTNLWLLPYGNLMTVLMILFLVLFGFSIMGGMEAEDVFERIKKDLGGRVDMERIERMIQQEKEREAANKMANFIEEQGLKQFVDVKITNEGVKVVLSNPVLFDVGKNALKGESRTILKTLIDAVRDLQNEIIIEGHTDDVPVRGGEFSSNWELSTARAFSVIEYFIAENISPKRLSAIGCGEYRPLYPNDTESHRSMNRRIEISVLNIP